jgi:hypothetical protein
LTSCPLKSIQKLATASPQVDRDAVFVFVAIDAFEKSGPTQ